MLRISRQRGKYNIHGRRRVNFGAEINSKEGGKKVSYCRLEPTASCRHDADIKSAPLRARSKPKSLGGSLSLPSKDYNTAKRR
jgi:hypothetical protein